MIRKLYATDDSPAIAILRLVLGVVFFVHGAQKMLGWFGGYGFSGTMDFFSSKQLAELAGLRSLGEKTRLI